MVEVPGLHCGILWRSRLIGNRGRKQRRKEKKSKWDERSVWMYGQFPLDKPEARAQGGGELNFVFT